jgi:hypothetical protein
MLATTLPFDAAAQRQAALAASLEADVLRFVAAASSLVRDELGLTAALGRVRGGAPVALVDLDRALIPLRRALGAHTASADRAAHTPAVSVVIPSLTDLQPVRVRDRCRTDVLNAVAADYTELYSWACATFGSGADGTLPPDVRAVLPHTPEALRVMLD